MVVIPIELVEERAKKQLLKRLTLEKMSEAKWCIVSPASINRKSWTVLKWSRRLYSVCRMCIRQLDA